MAKTVLELSNGKVIKTEETPETIEKGIADALNRKTSEIGPDQRVIPAGFLHVPVKKGYELVNAAQIVRVRKAPKAGLVDFPEHEE